MSIANRELTASELFALAHGYPLSVGDERCHFCGAPCRQTNYYFVVRRLFEPDERANIPDSCWICDGCQLMERQSATIFFHDGSYKDGCRWQDYSWVVTDQKAVAFGLEHKQALRQICLKPPLPPYVIVIAPGTGRYLPFAPVNRTKDEVKASFGNAVATWTVGDLQKLLNGTEAPPAGGLIEKLVWWFGIQVEVVDKPVNMPKPEVEVVVTKPEPAKTTPPVKPPPARKRR